METIKSTVLGELTQSKDWHDYWESALTEIPLFDNQKMKITFVDFEPQLDTSFIEQADAALVHFMKKDANYRLKISDVAYKNCMEFLNAIGYVERDKALWEMKEESEIWKFIYPEEINICRDYADETAIYIVIICECEWEQEHGLQFVFKHGKRLIRVSAIDGQITDETIAPSQATTTIENELPTTEKNSTKKDPIIVKKQSWWKKFWSNS